MRDLLLSYIIPLYNTQAFIARCLQSVIDQGMPTDAYEVIVVDDGSTDGGRALVEDFASHHPQVRLICQDNAGVSAARNAALDAARGRYLQFVDSDDYLVKAVMPRLLKRAIDESLDVLLFNYNCVDACGNMQPNTRGDNYAATTVMTGVDYLDAHAMTPYVWRFLIRRDFFETGCGYLGDDRAWRFDPSLIVCEDGALIARFMLAATRVAHDDDVAYCYVSRDDSAMHNVDLKHIGRRLYSQVDAAASIDATMRRFESHAGRTVPASVAGVRNVYLYFSMTKALTCGLVDQVLQRIRQAGMFPFPCVGPEANYHGAKWRAIHRLMMHPRVWKVLSKIYRLIKK